MAGLKDGDDFKNGEFFKAPRLLKVVFLALGAGFIGLFFLLRIIMPEKAGAMGYSWLFAVIFFLSLAIGGMFWTLLHHASNSGWGTVVRRTMENLGIMVPVVLLLGIPFLIPSVGFRDALWEWFPDRKAALEVAESKAQEDLPGYKQEWQTKIAEAQAAVQAAKAEFAATPSPSAGVTSEFEKRIARLEERHQKLAAHDVSDEGLTQQLEDKHFHHEAALLYVKKAYLNEKSWGWRYFFYLLALTTIAYILRRWSVNMDRDGDPKWFRWLRRASCGFLPFFATAWTFLVIDWLMGLDYAWFSTMWGVYLFSGAALNSMGLIVITITLLRRAGYLKDVITLEHYHLMGKLMLAFVIFWAYIAFSQFFLIWYANITEETKFYLTRNTGFWNVYTITFLVICHFFIPFVVLLLRKVKLMPAVLSGIAVWNLVMHVLDMYWIIIPERGPSLTAAAGQTLAMTIPGAWVFDIVAFLGVAGVFGFVFLQVLGSASLFPCRDPRLDESLNVVN